MHIKLLILLLAVTPICYGKILLDGTAATVGKTVITVRDARLYRSFQRLKENEKEIFKEEQGEELRKTVQKLALEEMLQSEIKSLKFETDQRAEADKTLRQIRTKRDADWKEFLSHYKISEKEAGARLVKSLEAEKFLQRKVETLTPIITDTEAERQFQKDPAYKGQTFEAAKSKVVFALKKERMQKGLEEWIRSLKDKYGLINHLGAG